MNRLRGGRGQHVQLRHFAAPEVAVGELGVWNHETRLADAAIAVPDDVEVERPWPPAHSGLPFPSALRLDFQAPLQQVGGGEPRVEQDHLVEEGPLLDGTERSRFFDARDREQDGFRKTAQATAGVRQVRRPIPQV